MMDSLLCGGGSFQRVSVMCEQVTVGVKASPAASRKSQWQRLTVQRLTKVVSCRSIVSSSLVAKTSSYHTVRVVCVCMHACMYVRTYVGA